jgi:gliding motility-associated-like protein
MQFHLFSPKLLISSRLHVRQWTILSLRVILIMFLILPRLSTAQPVNDTPCSATQLGELTLATPLSLMNANNQGAEGEEKAWYNHIIGEVSCQGQNVWNNTVYFSFTLDEPITGVTVTITPKGTGQFSAILLAAQQCAALQQANMGNWSPVPGNACASQPGEVITIWDDCLVHPGGNDVESIHRVFGGIVYLLVASDTDMQEGEFDIRIDAIPPTYCDGCLNGQETQVDGPPLPLVLQADGPTDLCPGESVMLSVPPVTDAVSYFWRNQDTGEVIENTSPSFTVTAPGTYLVDVVTECTPYQSNAETITLTLELEIPNLSMQGASTFCQGDSLLLSVIEDPNRTYQWYRDGEVIGSNGQAHQYWAYESGSYVLQVSNACQSVETEAVSLIVHPVPAAPAVVDGVVCEGETVTLEAYSPGATAYHWYSESGELLPDQTGPELILSELKETQYFQVAAFNHEDCESPTVNVAAQVAPLPQAAISADTNIIVLGQPLLLSAKEGIGYTYQWSPAESLSSATVAQPLARPEDNTTYTLWVRSPEGCMSMDTLSIIVQKVLVIPNTFTPNEDGMNDTWQITNLERFPGNRLRIVNRWGQTVLETNNYDQSWQGDFQGRPLPEDTYFYVIDKNNGDPALSGPITIIR